MSQVEEQHVWRFPDKREFSQKNLGPGRLLQTLGDGVSHSYRTQLKNLYVSLCENCLNSKQRTLQFIKYIFT